MHILSIIVFLVLIALTLVITARAAKRSRQTRTFMQPAEKYPAGKMDWPLPATSWRLAHFWELQA